MKSRLFFIKGDIAELLDVARDFSADSINSDFRYVRELEVPSWNENQASSQFQGEGSSHNLAAGMLNEAIQHPLFALPQPIFILYLDAQSAFDVVLRELLVRNLFNCNTSGHSLLYISNRLGNRRNYTEK